MHPLSWKLRNKLINKSILINLSLIPFKLWGQNYKQYSDVEKEEIFMKMWFENKKIMTKRHEKVCHPMKVNNENALEAQNKCCNMLT